MKIRYFEPHESPAFEKPLKSQSFRASGMIGLRQLADMPVAQVVITAGEKDAKALKTIFPELVVLTATGESLKLRLFSKLLGKRRVTLCYDEDAKGKEQVLLRAAELWCQAAEVRICHLPLSGEKGAKDICDYFRLHDGEDREILRELLLKAPVYEPPMKPELSRSPELPTPGKSPEIHYSTPDGEFPLHVVTSQALQVLAAQCKERIYARSGKLVRTLRHTVDDGPKDGIERGNSIRIADLPDAALREALSESAVWYITRRTRGGDIVRTDKWPPKPVVDAVRDRGEYPMLRELVGVVEAPTIRPDGTIVQEPGHDATTGLLYVPSRAYRPVPADPTSDQIDAALDTLTRPFDEFALETAEDLASLIALMLTIAGRPAVDRCVPHWTIQAPSYGSGKTLLVEACTVAMTGRDPDSIAPPGGRRDEGDAEMRKTITTLVREAPRVVIVDNVHDGSTWRCVALAKALTSSIWTDRLLSKNEAVRLPHRIVWTSTGCNYRLWGDLVRRSLSIVIIPGVENPQERTFRIGDLLGYAREHHPELLVAALTLLRGFVVAGRPGHGKAALGKFEQWDALIRACVFHYTRLDPLATQERLKEEAPDKGGLRELLHAWNSAFGAAGMTAKDAVELAKDDETLREAILGIGGGKKGEPSSHLLGNRIRAKKGDVVDGRRFVKEGHSRPARWAVTGGSA